MRKGSLALWGPTCSHLIIMPSPWCLSSRVNARLSCQKSYFSAEHVGGKSTVLSQAEQIQWLGLSIPKPKAVGEQILHVESPEM